MDDSQQDKQGFELIPIPQETLGNKETRNSMKFVASGTRKISSGIIQ